MAPQVLSLFGIFVLRCRVKAHGSLGVHRGCKQIGEVTTPMPFWWRSECSCVELRKNPPLPGQAEEPCRAWRRSPLPKKPVLCYMCDSGRVQAEGLPPRVMQRQSQRGLSGWGGPEVQSKYR